MVNGDLCKIKDKTVKTMKQGEGWAVIWFTDGTKLTIGVK